MSDLVDSYSESNSSNDINLSSGDFFGVAQSFTATDRKIVEAQFYAQKAGLPTGNAVAKLYAHSGTFGTSSVAGALLATSDLFDTSTLPASAALVPFVFSGANQYEMSAETKYVISVEFSGGDAANRMRVFRDNVTVSHAGNESYNNGVWNAEGTGWDLLFYVYGEAAGGGPAGNFDTSPRIIRSPSRLRVF